MSRTRRLDATGKAFRRTFRTWAGQTLGALVVTACLAACGGDAQDEAAHEFVHSIATQGAAAPMHKLADAWPAATPPAAAVAVPGAKELFDWAEYKYPDLFSPKQTMPDYELTYEGRLYTVRSFPNGNHLGLSADGRIYGLGPFTGNVLQDLGAAADYAAAVAADKCRVLPSSCAFVWKLVAIADYENSESWKTSPGDFWQLSHTYSRGRFGAKSWHRDDQNYVAYGTLASWARPPNVIYAGEKVELGATITQTEYTDNWSGGSASTYADFATPERGLGQRGDVIFSTPDKLTDIHIVAGSNTSASGTFSATAPHGESNKRIALRLQYYMGTSMATYYIYEWLPVGTKVNPPEPYMREILIGFSDAKQIRIGGAKGQIEISFGSDEEEYKDLVDQDINRINAEGLVDGMRIRTGSGGRIMLSWVDSGLLVIDQDTVLRFKKVSSAEESQLTVVAGEIWASFKKVLNYATMETKMNHARAGIKGTTFILRDNEYLSTLKVIEGSVEFTSTSDGKMETVNAGEMISASEAGIGIKTTFDIAAEQNKWDELLTSMASYSAHECLFNWAELNYPELLSPRMPPSRIQWPYHFRYYAASPQGYLGVSLLTDDLLYLGDLSNNQILELGPVSTWLTAAGCAAPQ